MFRIVYLIIAAFLVFAFWFGDRLVPRYVMVSDQMRRQNPYKYVFSEDEIDFPIRAFLVPREIELSGWPVDKFYFYKDPHLSTSGPAVVNLSASTDVDDLLTAQIFNVNAGFDRARLKSYYLATRYNNDVFIYESRGENINFIGNRYLGRDDAHIYFFLYDLNHGMFITELAWPLDGKGLAVYGWNGERAKEITQIINKHGIEDQAITAICALRWKPLNRILSERFDADCSML